MQKIGVIGMSVMGRNLALNIANHGYSVSIFNRSPLKTNQVIAENPKKKLIPCYSIEELIFSLTRPRFILLMVKAGKSTDQVIDSLTPMLERGDTVIDGGNAFYKDTIRRNHNFLKNGLNFIGVGISGGQEGALKGPSIMPGGERHVYDLIAPIFQDIAARANNEPCVTYIGPDGAGHYLKMIHNGIEYADMQLIAEAYAFLKYSVNLTNAQLADIFRQWNQGELSSFLIKITADILVKREEKGGFLLDTILDEASHKNTGKWVSQSSLDLGEPCNLIAESVFARYLSSLKKQRLIASKMLNGPKVTHCNIESKSVIEKVRRALYFSKIVSYAQGFSQLRVASEAYQWNMNYGEIAKIFRAGCIIQAQFLQKVSDAYFNDPKIANLLLAPCFNSTVNRYQQALRDIISYAIHKGISIPAFSAAISYYDSYRSAVLPANLIQAQRDYFGAHTYKRIDKQGTFHTEW